MRSLLARFLAPFRGWGAMTPLLAAEVILWVGFGALLPVMPIYFTQHNVDIALLGVVVAAWPAARLVAEPVSGWLADRWPRVPLMVAGLVLSGAAVGMALVWTGFVPFVILRALAGVGTAMFDPAARGTIADWAPRDRRGEAFGFYAAASTVGLLMGPAIGGVGASLFGGIAFVFGLSAVASFVAAAVIGLRLREIARSTDELLPGSASLGEFPADADRPREAASAAESDVTSLANRLLVTAIAFNLGQFLAGGIYEVVWSLFLTSRGAGLDLVGLTFAMWSIPVILFSPAAGRLADRAGPLWLLVAGTLAMIGTMIAYPFMTDVRQVIPLILVEATGYAILSPALYAVVVAGSPAGRRATAQGIFGAVGTLGTIGAAILAGILAAVDIRYPFFFGAAVSAVMLAVGLAIGGARLRRLVPVAIPPG